MKKKGHITQPWIYVCIMFDKLNIKKEMRANRFYFTSMNSKHFLLAKWGTGTGYKCRTWGRGGAFRKCLLISESSKQWHKSFRVHKSLDRDCFCNVAYVHHHNGSNIKPMTKCDWSEEPVVISKCCAYLRCFAKLLMQLSCC